MIPLRDSVASRTTPFVNVAIIGICALVFFAQLSVGEGEPTLVEQYGMIPARVTHPELPVEIPVSQEQVMTPEGPALVVKTREAVPSPVPPILTLLTCVFLHGGWMHFLGNMWFLWIFGDNVEDRFGHLVYLLFYLGCGLIASLAHYVTGPESMIPTIGASGAIAGVMGAYFVLYPKAKVVTLLPLFIFVQVIVVPAPLFLGIWFLIQAFQGTMSMSAGAATGVAWWAHIGGFVAGVIAAFFVRQTNLLSPPVTESRLTHPEKRTYRGHPTRGEWY